MGELVEMIQLRLRLPNLVETTPGAHNLCSKTQGVSAPSAKAGGSATDPTERVRPGRNSHEQQSCRRPCSHHFSKSRHACSPSCGVYFYLRKRTVFGCRK